MSEKLEERIKGFNDDIKPIFEKYRLAMSVRTFIKDGLIMGEPVLIDTTPKEKPTESTVSQ